MAAKKKISDKKNIHVIPRADGWVVRHEGSIRPSSTHKTQREAVDAGRKIASSQSSALVIHRSDGRVRERHSYGSDPLPPKEPRSVLFPETSASVSKDTIKEAVTAVVRESKSSSSKGSSSSTARH